jgi:hypothetical protein
MKKETHMIIAITSNSQGTTLYTLITPEMLLLRCTWRHNAIVEWIVEQNEHVVRISVLKIA